MSILAAILNALILFVTMGIIAADAIEKLKYLQSVNETIVMWVAAPGILINAFTAWLFMKGKEKDLNLKGVFLHMAGDAAVALGVVIAGFLIKVTGDNWIDPANELCDHYRRGLEHLGFINGFG